MVQAAQTKAADNQSTPKQLEMMALHSIRYRARSLQHWRSSLEFVGFGHNEAPAETID